MVSDDRQPSKRGKLQLLPRWYFLGTLPLLWINKRRERRRRPVFIRFSLLLFPPLLPLILFRSIFVFLFCSSLPFFFYFFLISVCLPLDSSVPLFPQIFSSIFVFNLHLLILASLFFSSCQPFNWRPGPYSLSLCFFFSLKTEDEC